jgi:glycosyltransferase involved in cell wall biosynthesis
MRGVWRSYGMSKDIGSLRPTVFHGLSHELPFGKEMRHVRKLVTIHDLIFQHFPQDFPWLDRQIYAAKWKHSLHTADKVIAISESTRTDLLEQYGLREDKIEVIYQACDAAYYAPLPSFAQMSAFRAEHQLPQDYLLSVGSITERKNLLTVVRALHAIPRDQRPVLVVVGEGKAYKMRVLQEISALGLQNYVHFWPKHQVSIAELRLLYAGAVATVFPSLFEGFGLPVTESLLSGTPVITSNRSSLPEAAGPGAILIHPLEVLEVRDAMVSLMTDREICRRLANNGYKFVRERFDPERVTQKLIMNYK